MKILLPEIRIKNAWLLREQVSEPLNELWGDGTPLRTHEEYEVIVRKYRKAWPPYEQKILTGLCDTLQLQFRQNTIDVYIAPWFYAFSDPLVIGVTQKPREFIDTLTHELVHRLLTDNTTLPHETFLVPEGEKLFGSKHSMTTTVHIPVHAVHKAIYLNVLQEPTGIERDIELCKAQKAEDYLASWEYVNKHGYQEIIEKLKQSYTQLS